MMNLAFESVDKPLCATIKLEATEQYFSATLFSVLYKVALIFESMTKF